MTPFLRHYLIAALWSSTDGIDPLDDNYSLDDIAPSCLTEAEEDCKAFQEQGADLLQQAYAFYVESGMSNHHDAGSPQACAGHDFWLTRNSHGVGFWDRGMGEVGEKLTELSKQFGQVDLYVGDDGLIYS